MPEFVQIQPGYGRIRQYAYQAKGDSMDEAGIREEPELPLGYVWNHLSPLLPRRCGCHRCAAVEAQRVKLGHSTTPSRAYH